MNLMTSVSVLLLTFFIGILFVLAAMTLFFAFIIYLVKGGKKKDISEEKKCDSGTTN